MANFCTNCGKELKNGKCDCIKKGNISSNDLVNKCLDLVKGLFKSPVTTIKENTKEENYKFGLFLLVVASVVTGLFTYFLLDNMTSIRLFGMYQLMEISFIKVFLASFILSAIWYGVLGGITYLFANKLFKLNINVKEVFAFVGVISVYLTLTLLVSIILIFVSYKLMTLVLVLGSLFYSTYFLVGLMEVTKIEKDKIAYLYVPVLTISFFIVYYVLPKLLG